jgi:hypothetical protein
MVAWWELFDTLSCVILLFFSLTLSAIFILSDTSARNLVISDIVELLFLFHKFCDTLGNPMTDHGF